MKTVLVNKPIHPDALERLRQEVDVLTPYQAGQEAFSELLTNLEGVIVCSAVTVGGEEMDRAERLEVIGRHGAGLDIVDVVAATQRGLPVVFTPYGPTESTAEHTLLLILACARRLIQLDRAMRNGAFDIRDHLRGKELKGASLGIVGFGRIGRRVAQMCRAALDMSIYVFDPYVDSATIVELGATPVHDVVELACMVDVLSAHVPLTDQTRHLIDRDVIHALGADGILVNASRGAVVDEAALIEALKAGALGSAGLDVFDPEPPAVDNPLLEMDQVVLSPHVASATQEGRRRMGMAVVEDTLRVLRGEKPQHLANPTVWESRSDRTT